MQTPVGRNRRSFGGSDTGLTAAAERSGPGAIGTFGGQPAGADGTEKLIGGADLVFRGQTAFGKRFREDADGGLQSGRNFVVTAAGSVDKRVQDETADEQQNQQDRTRFPIGFPHENSGSSVDELPVI